MGFKHIHQQLELSKKAVSEMNNGISIFENLMAEVVKGAPEQDKKTIEDVRIKANKAIQLAKQGKSDEAQQIIKDLQNGR